MSNQQDENPGPDRRVRRPYSPPRIVESGAFEHLVLACAHTVPEQRCFRTGMTNS